MMNAMHVSEYQSKLAGAGFEPIESYIASRLTTSPDFRLIPGRAYMGIIELNIRHLPGPNLSSEPRLPEPECVGDY